MPKAELGWMRFSFILDSCETFLQRVNIALCDRQRSNRGRTGQGARKPMEGAVARILHGFCTILSSAGGSRARMSQTSSMRRGRPSRDGRAVRPRRRSRPKPSSPTCAMSSTDCPTSTPPAETLNRISVRIYLCWRCATSTPYKVKSLRCRSSTRIRRLATKK